MPAALRYFFCTLLFCLSLSASGGALWAAVEVELMVQGQDLRPSTTLELRFSKDMVSAEQLGIPAEESPVVITPSLPGRFVWLSRRSGVYVPSAPPRMGSTFVVGLRAGLVDAARQPVLGDFKAVLKTPVFSAFSELEREADSDWPSNGSAYVVFNRNVELKRAASFFRFVDRQGRSIAAVVRYVNGSDFFQPRQGVVDWDEAWTQPKPVASGAEDVLEVDTDETVDEPQTDAQPCLNRLVVTPAEPLPAGKGWRLEVKAGLRSLTGGYTLGQPRSFNLGQVQPFVVQNVLPTSYLNGGRSISLTFSQQLAPDVTEKTAARFFRVSPEPGNLSFECDYRGVTVRGDFDRGTSYTVEVEPSLLAESGLALSGPQSFPIGFKPVAPRVYLPEITGHQILDGRRKFPVQSVNVKTLRVRAVLVPVERAAVAAGAFSAYRKEFDAALPDEAYQALAPDLIQGRVLFEREFPVIPGVVDARQETILDWNQILGAHAGGVIFLTVEGTPMEGMTAKHLGAQALVQLTDLGVLWKKDSVGLRVTVFSMATGKMLEGVQIRVLGTDLVEAVRGESGAKGDAVLKMAGVPEWLVIQRADDVHVVRLGSETELPMAAFQIPMSYDDWSGAQRVGELRALLFTDRPLYHPGETVRVKGIVRRSTSAKLVPEVEREGVLSLRLPRDRGIRKMKVRTDESGSFDAEFVLEAGMTGGFGVNLEFDQDESYEWRPGFHTRFVVADFQANGFEVFVKSPERFSPEEPVKMGVSGRYLFGGSLAAAHANWTLQMSPTSIEPPGFGKFSFSEHEGSNAKGFTLRGSGKFSETGELGIEPKLPEAAGVSFSGQMTVEVTDLNQQTVTQKARFVRDSAAFYVGLKLPMDEVSAAKKAVKVQCVAVGVSGEPLSEVVPVKVELIRVRHDVVRLQGAGRAVSFRTDKTEEVEETVETRSVDPVRNGAGWDVLNEVGVFVTPKIPGVYRVRVSAKDSAGRSTVASYSLQVSGEGATAWSYRNPAQVDLVPNKREYRPGDVAKILLKTPISGEAVVTVERGNTVLRSRHLSLEGNAPEIEVPLEAGDTPNVFVSVTLVRGAKKSTRKVPLPEYRYGVCELRVSTPDDALSVSLKPVQSRVEPGQEIVTEVLIQDGMGRVVPNALVTFYAIDDGILALTGYKRPEPREVFEAPYLLGVRTGLTLYELLPEDPDDLQYANKGYLIGGGGGGAPGPKLRTNFPGTACWFPKLQADAQGRLQVRFKAPDALTRYRLVAVAQAGGAQFGSGESAVEIQKPFLILSALGQGAHKGDEILARALVRNNTGQDGVAEIVLGLDSLAEAGGESRSFTVPVRNGETRPVDFPVRLWGVGSAEWKWSGKLKTPIGVFEDALAVHFKVGSAAPVLRETYLSNLGAKSNDLLSGVNSQILEGEGTARVTVSNTRLASLNESAEGLLRYPYGCAEQTVSGLIPWIVVNDLGPVLPVVSRSREEMQKAVKEGVRKVLAQQVAGGGISYWPGRREPQLFASAYAGMALGILQKQGVELGPEWPLLLGYLSRELRDMNEKAKAHAMDEYALVAFALATANVAESGYHEGLLARQAELSMEGRALLACAIMQAKGSLEPVAKLLTFKGAVPPGDSNLGSATREQAIRLMAWSWYKPKDRELERLVKEVLEARKNGRWRTTQENAWSLLALSRYFGSVEREIQAVDAVIHQAGKATTVALSKTEFAKTIDLSFGGGVPVGPLWVENPGRSNLYGEIRLEVVPPVSVQPRQDRGFGVSRSYSKLGDDGQLGDVGDLRVGDRVLVTLRVDAASEAHFVAVDDPLPAILEAVNPEFRTQEMAGGAAFIRNGYADYRELRSDRVLYFRDHMPAGITVYQYLARVRSAGKVSAPATKVEEMYYPEHFGLSATGELQAKPR